MDLKAAIIAQHFRTLAGPTNSVAAMTAAATTTTTTTTTAAAAAAATAISDTTCVAPSVAIAPSALAGEEVEGGGGDGDGGGGEGGGGGGGGSVCADSFTKMYEAVGRFLAKRQRTCVVGGGTSDRVGDGGGVGQWDEAEEWEKLAALRATL